MVPVFVIGESGFESRDNSQEAMQESRLEIIKV